MTAAVVPLGANDSFAGNIRIPGELDKFQVTIPDSGRLTADVHTCTTSSLHTRLSLLGTDGQLLIQSDGARGADATRLADDRIVQHLLAGTYFVQVQGLGAGTGAYTLTTDLQPANPPNQPLLTDFPGVTPFVLTPNFSVTGDFDRDGTLDIATANTFTNDVTVLLGRGDGTFHSAGNFGVGTLPYGIVAGDFNGDGILDLAVANQNVDPVSPSGVSAPSYDISILLGNGDGTFKPERRISAGNRAWGIAAADFNGDGHLDLVIANAGSNDVSVLLGNGDGTFQPEVRYPVGEFPTYVLTGDFNNDGHVDIAVTNLHSNDLSILLGRGDGTFAKEIRIPTGAQSYGMAAGDFNSDGRLDLAVANNGGSAVVILLGNGDGTFQSPVAYAVGSDPNHVAVGDFNGDGQVDLAVANRQSNDVSVLLGRGDGTFQEEVSYRAGLQPLFTIVGDFNGDGVLDLATANGRSHDVSILLGKGDGTFQDDLTDPRPNETNPLGTVVADFNGDGIPDLATVTYTGHDVIVFLGRGDGTFGPGVSYQVGSTPVSLIAADVNGDGKLDLVTANCDSVDISVLLGNGDGTFQPQKRFPANNSGEFLLAGDFNGDGHLDLIDSGEYSNGISLLLGNGDGTFQAPRQFGGEDAPAGGVVGDFNGDGKLDLAVTNFFSPNHDIAVFLGNGDGTFQPEVHYPVGDAPFGILAGDFDRNGTLDLAVADSGSNDISVLLGRGDGTFRPEVRYAVGAGPDSIVGADFNHDGRFDLAVSNAGSSDISVLLGRGDGTFRDQVRFVAGDGPTPRYLVTADLNGDGRIDLVASQALLNNVAVLLGRGDGTFQASLQTPVGLGPAAFTTGDFNNDGRDDVASVNPNTNEVSVSLGVGDATLEKPVHFAVGAAPAAIVKGDFNRDGRLDLASANYGSGDVSVLLGLGDGTFRQEQRFSVGRNPVAIVAADFTGDGLTDLVTANAGSNDVSVLLGRGDGTFQSQIRLPAGDLPDAVVTGDFNGDGHLDLAVANYRSQDVWVYLGRGDGTFRAPLRFQLGESPVALVAGDFNGDGQLDLATAGYLSNDVSVLLGLGDGTFQRPVRYNVGMTPVSLVTSDFNNDGALDLATANSISRDVSILLGRGDGTFADQIRQPVGDYPTALVGDDFTANGITDLAIATQLSPTVSTLQGLGDMRFIPGGAISNPIHATPLVVDLNGDAPGANATRLAVAVVGRQGKILLRLARPGAPGVFESPVTVNPSPDPAARALAVISTPQGQELAALDAGRPSLSFYERRPDGTFIRRAGPTIPGTLPVALAAGDLNGDGLTDLVVADAGSDEVLVYLQHPGEPGVLTPGVFGPTPDYDLHVGISPSALNLVDVDGDGRLDIVVANQFSGDVSVLHNEAGAGFASESRFRAGTGLYWLDKHDDKLVVRSREGTAGLVAGDFAGGPGSDLIAVNSGVNSFSVLTGDGRGGLLNPTTAQTYRTGLRPTVAVAGRFTADPNLDLAILNQESGDISIFLGDGHGGFTEKVVRDTAGRKLPLSAGYLPTGLAAADINGDGKLDLLVGNDYGDILILLGNGDGTFQPYQRTGRNVALAVADLKGNGQDDFVFANEALDQVSVSYGGAPPAVFQDRRDGLLAPSAVKLVDLNGDGLPDLVVANGGGNSVLVYPGLPGGGFGPEANGGKGFFVGTNPVGITVQDVNSDGLPDLVVANQGSNDVSVLLGERRPDGSWTLTPGPRLDAHGVGPDSTAVRFVPDPRGGPALPQILVANGGSNDVVEVPGVGNGFFDDRAQSVRTFSTGQDPRQVLVGNFINPNELDLVTINSGSNDLTFFPGFGAGRSIDAGGDRPVAALEGDFNGDGLSDLLVANNGDGHISLLLGSIEGPALTRIFARQDLLHPTALAMGETASVIYASEEGEEAVARFTLDFGVAVTAHAGELSVVGPERQIADFLPLKEAALATVATLLTVTAEQGMTIHDNGGDPEGSGGDEPTELTGDDSLRANAPGLWRAGGVNLRSPADLSAYIIGLEKALERGERELREELFSPDKRPPVVVDRLSAAVKEITNAWQPAIAGVLGDSGTLLAQAMLDTFRPAGALVGSALASSGLRHTPLDDLPWRDVAEALLQTGLSTTRPVTDAVRSLFLDEARESIPARLNGIQPPLPEPREEQPEISTHKEDGDDSWLPVRIAEEQADVLAAPLPAVFFAWGVWHSLVEDKTRNDFKKMFA
jgi:hypothetical protein